MQTLPPCYSLRAAMLFSPLATPQENAWINIKGGNITSIGSATETTHFDPGDCAVLPGLVNAHAHLEFSDLESPLGRGGMPLPDWIGKVLAWRSSGRRQSIQERIGSGIEQSLAGGVVAVADIVSEQRVSIETPLHYHAFEEVIAASEAQHTVALQRVDAVASSIAAGSCRGGISPHAPYSVAPAIWERAVQRARDHNIPLAVHLAETRDELSFLADGTGPFATLLADRGAIDFMAAGRTPQAFLNMLARAPSTLIAHGNYLTVDEIQFLAAHRDCMTLVYCPRTHNYFGHDRYPLATMLDAGARVAIGTDGRGSNPDLSLWRELQHIAQTHAEVPGEAILEMGTLNGAEGLSLADRIGTIEAGKEASLAVVRFTDVAHRNSYARLFDSTSEVIATIIAGNLVGGSLE